MRKALEKILIDKGLTADEELVRLTKQYRIDFNPTTNIIRDEFNDIALWSLSGSLPSAKEAQHDD